jgi:glycine/D-amino acid oxidase-like deaminating enzyme
MVGLGLSDHSAVMGYSNDGFPYVGPIPGRAGRYMCAGFTGHGMPQIFLSAKAMATIVLQGDTEEVDLPLPYCISGARWAEPKTHASLEVWQRFRDSESA